MFESLTKKFDGIRARLAGRARLTEANIEESLREVRMALLEADVNFRVCKEFIAKVKDRAVGDKVISGVNPGDLFIKLIHESLVELMGPEDTEVLWQKSGPTVILMAGLQGSGKTTTCGKLAMQFKKDGKRPLLVAADVQRPAAIEQLQVLGQSIDVPVHAEVGGDPIAICQSAVAEALANDLNVVILDTAGRLHVDDTLMDEVSRIAGAAEPHEVFFVLDANTGQDAFNSATAFNEKLALSGIILTKMDSGTRGGAALSARSVIGKPIKFVGVGEKLDDLQVFHPDRLADRILGMGDVVSLVEKAQEVIDEEEAEKAAKQLFEGSFSFDDFLRTLQMVKSMGPIKDLMKMVPGMGSQMEALDNLDEREFDRNEAIILSMTLQERSHPEILNMSRRERIAHGSGVQVQKVHDMIRGFKQMKTQMKDMRKSGMLGKMFNPEKQFRRQKKSELKQLEKEGGSVLDLPAFKDLRPGAAGTRTKKQKKRKKRR